jgi:DHA1 family inner membrane transport protein
MARRTLLLLMMTIFTLGNICSAMAPTFESFTLLRFITGLPHGAFFGVAALVAASMVPINRRVRAVGQVMLGLTIATLVGTPIATLLGQLLNWRAAFMMVGAVGALTVVLIAMFLPKDKVSEGAGVMRELGALRRVQVWLTLAIAAVGFGGMFSIFTYIASTTTDVAGMSTTMIPVVLALFGIGMNVGNVVGSRLADISLTGTIGGMLAFNVVIMTIFSLTAANPVMLCICVFLIGCGFANTRCRLQPFGLQRCQRAWSLARRPCYHVGLYRCLDGLCRRGTFGRWPGGIWDINGPGASEPEHLGFRSRRFPSCPTRRTHSLRPNSPAPG